MSWVTHVKFKAVGRIMPASYLSTGIHEPIQHDGQDMPHEIQQALGRWLAYPIDAHETIGHTSSSRHSITRFELRGTAASVGNLVCLLPLWHLLHSVAHNDILYTSYVKESL